MTSTELEQNKDYQKWKEEYGPEKMSWEKYQVLYLGRKELINCWLLNQSPDRKEPCEYVEEWGQCEKPTEWWLYAAYCPKCKSAYFKQNGVKAICSVCEKDREFTITKEDRKVHWVCQSHQQGESQNAYENIRACLKNKDIGVEE